MSHPVLVTVGTGRVIDVTQLDRPAVFLCFAQATEKAAEPIEIAIRERYTAAQVLIAYVVDLHSVPGMFRSIAEGMLKSEYDKAVRALPSGESAENFVVLLPDWDGAFVRSLGFSEDVSKRLGVAVFGRDGTLAGLVQEPSPVDNCLEVLDRVVR